MAEQVKVFKNVHSQTASGAAHSITLASTGATERAVIKDVSCGGVLDATLDLDGRTVATSTQDMIASGSLIMDVNSTLTLKFPYITPPMSPSFRGMFFSNGTDSINYIVGDGVGAGLDTSATSVVNRGTGSNNEANSAFAAFKNGVLTFFRYHSGSMYEYISTSTSAIAGYSFGSGHGSCTDGTYMYNIPSGSTTTVYRRHIMTGVDSNFSCNSTVQGQGDNQGSFLEYHDGHLYTKNAGGSNEMHVIKISDGSVTTVTNAQLSGDYSDGGTIVTTVAGKSYIVETSTNQWQWYEIGGSKTQFTNESGSSGASTEYGDGGVEIAPGIAMIFCEQSDDLTIIDMNTSPPGYQHISSATSRNMAVHNGFGNRFAMAGYLERESFARTYDAYTSGVLITEDA